LAETLVLRGLRGVLASDGRVESASDIAGNFLQAFFSQTPLVGSTHQLLTGLRAGIFKPVGDFSGSVSQALTRRPERSPLDFG
jgi:hypothetical protein